MAGLQIVTSWTGGALKHERPLLSNPKINRSQIILTTNPRSEPYFAPKANLYVDVLYNPLDLISLPYDRMVVGILATRLMHEGLFKLRDWPGFPYDLLTRAVNQFEAAGFLLVHDLKNAVIPKTRARGRIIAEVSGERTIVSVEIATSDLVPLFRRKVWEQPGAHWLRPSRLKSITLLAGLLVVGDPEDMLAPGIVIDLADLPDEARALLAPHRSTVASLALKGRSQA